MAVMTVAVALTGGAQLAPRCHFCATLLTGQAFQATDRVRGEPHYVCGACSRSPDRCAVCSLPLGAKARHPLPDGRLYCERDWPTLVLEQRQAEELFRQARRETGRMLADWGRLPDENIVFTLVDKDEFLRQYRRTPSMHDPEKIEGLTRSQQLPDGRFEHRIFVLNGLRRGHFLAVCAHEYAHAWLAEHGRKARQIHHDTVEGFCELLAWKLVEQLRDPHEQRRIEQNEYTRGQFGVLHAAQEAHRFHRVVDWVLGGVDGWLEKDGLQRLHVLRDDAVKPRPAEAPRAIRTVPVPPPDKLVLRGVLGTTRSGRAALINDRLMKADETASMRLGVSNVVVRCVEVRSHSAVVAVGEAGERLELFLNPK
jgi:hypothetical protein